ncbi:MAG: hypothetical protein GXY83_20010 [Rhodopirellula sp.]|nr:hypothetical protein [Rhodopirellula sp.]
MIPDFNDQGYLPPGVHLASLDEIESRFGRQSEIRQVQMESLRWLVESARKAGVLRIIVNGSFVTDIYEPNDVDCVLLIDSEYPSNSDAEEVISNGMPFLEIKLTQLHDFEFFVYDLFASDRYQSPKGVVEVIP